MPAAIDNEWTCTNCSRDFVPRKDGGELEDFMYICKECLNADDFILNDCDECETAGVLFDGPDFKLCTNCDFIET